MPKGSTASVSSAGVAQRRVTTPSGAHTVSQAAGKAAGAFTPLRGTHERARNGLYQAAATRAGTGFTSAVRTAIFRQNRAMPVRTFGMAPVVHVRTVPGLR